MELVVALLMELQSSDYRSWATFHVPFDEALEVDCDLAVSDDLAGCLVEHS